MDMGQNWTHHLDPHTKRCSGCKEVKDLIEFSTNAARFDGLANYCRPCRHEQQREIREKQRRGLIDQFGGKCVRCGFTDWRALQFDHVNNDGAVDRRAGGHNQRVLKKLLTENPGRFQLLCANCNNIKRYEERECPGRSDQVRADTPAERTFTPRGPSTRTTYNPRRTLAAEAKGQAIAALAVERRPLQKSPVRLPQGSWSRFYERCLGCQETTRSHASDGCCYKCDKLIKGYNRRVSVFGPVPVEESAEQADLTTI